MKQVLLSFILCFSFAIIAKANNVTVNNLTGCNIRIHANGSTVSGSLLYTFPPGSHTEAATGDVDVAKIYVGGIEPSFPMGFGISIFSFNSIAAGYPQSTMHYECWLYGDLYSRFCYR